MAEDHEELADSDAPPTELVGEDDVEGPTIGQKADDSGADPPEPFLMLQAHLKSHGLQSTLQEDGFGWEIRFDLPAGRDKRSVSVVSEEQASRLLSVDFRLHRSLGRYNGLWIEAMNQIEVHVIFEPSRASALLSLRYHERRTEGTNLGIDNGALEMSDAETGVSIRIAPASDLAKALATRREPMTMTISGVPVSSTEAADALVEKLGDAVAVEFALQTNAVMLVDRVRERSYHPASFGTKKPIEFPDSTFPHSVVLLYLSARQRQTSPLIRYWSYYGVLEYLFPKYAAIEARHRAAQTIRDRRFNKFSDADVTRLVEGIAKLTQMSSKESEQLVSTVKGIVSEEDLRDFITAAGLADRLRSKKNSASTISVDVERDDDVRRAIGRRVYEIRCNIVHSKSDGGPNGAASGGFIPGAAEEDLVAAELPLLRFLAEKALFDSVERLQL